MISRTRGTTAWALAGSLTMGWTAAARAQTPATVDVAVDATAAGMPLERIWPNVGYDEINYTTTADGKALLKTLADANTAQLHVRTHFLLNTGDGTASLKWGSTNAYTEDASGNPIYNWTLMDGIMDTITGTGSAPLTEIAFMPQALSTHPTPYQNSTVRALDGGCFYPPKDYNKWSALIRAWVTHVKDRYPSVQNTWLWELWNEPNIGYWHGTFAEYAKLYDYTEAAVHAVLPGAPVGGPAVSTPATFLTQFLQHCANGANALTGAAGTRLDLVTFHAKGGVGTAGGHVQMDLGNQLRLHRDGFSAVAAFPAFKQKPIYITEADPDGCAACPISEVPANAYRNSPAYGAYEIAMMKRTLELEARLGVKVGGLITWAFTFPNTPYFPGYRTFTTNGISLPVLGAFKLLGSLTGTRLPITSSGALSLDAILAAGIRGAQPDVDAMATLNGQQVQVLVWNYHDALTATTASPVHLTVKVPASFGARVTVSHLRVDESHGDAYTIWTAQGSPTAPSATVLSAMRQGMDPQALPGTPALAVTAGTVVVDFDLPRFGVSLLTLTPATGVIDAGADGPPSLDGGGVVDVAADVPGRGDAGIGADVGAGGSDVSGAVDAAAGDGPDAPPTDAPAGVEASALDGALAMDAPADQDQGSTDATGVGAEAGADRNPGSGGAPAGSSGCSCDFGDAGRLPAPAGHAALLISVVGAALARRARRRSTSAARNGRALPPPAPTR